MTKFVSEFQVPQEQVRIFTREEGGTVFVMRETDSDFDDAQKLLRIEEDGSFTPLTYYDTHNREHVKAQVNVDEDKTSSEEPSPRTVDGFYLVPRDGAVELMRINAPDTFEWHIARITAAGGLRRASGARGAGIATDRLGRIKVSEGGY